MYATEKKRKNGSGHRVSYSGVVGLKNRLDRMPQFCNRHCKFQADDIAGASNFNTAPESPQNGGLPTQILHFRRYLSN